MFGVMPPRPDAARRPLVVRRAARGLRVRDDVVDDRRIARTELDRLDPLVFGQVRRDADVLIRDRAIGRDLELLGHREDRVGLADRPALGERRGGPADRGRRRAARRASTQAAIVSTSFCESRGSFLKTPCGASAVHGGISRLTTRCLMARAQGRVSSYVISDIGANIVGRWQLTQFCRESARRPWHRSPCPGRQLPKAGRSEQPEGASRDETLHGVLHKSPPRK